MKLKVVKIWFYFYFFRISLLVYYIIAPFIIKKIVEMSCYMTFENFWEETLMAMARYEPNIEDSV